MGSIRTLSQRGSHSQTVIGSEASVEKSTHGDDAGEESRLPEAPVLKDREPWTDKEIDKMVSDTRRLAQAVENLSERVNALGELLDRILQELDDNGDLSDADKAALQEVRDAAKKTEETAATNGKHLRELMAALDKPAFQTAGKALKNEDRAALEKLIADERNAVIGVREQGTKPEIRSREKHKVPANPDHKKVRDNKARFNKLNEAIDAADRGLAGKNGKVLALLINFQKVASDFAKLEKPDRKDVDAYNDALRDLDKAGIFSLLDNKVAAILASAAVLVALDWNAETAGMEQLRVPRRGLAKYISVKLGEAQKWLTNDTEKTALKSWVSATEKIEGAAWVDPRLIMAFQEARKAKLPPVPAEDRAKFNAMCDALEAECGIPTETF